MPITAKANSDTPRELIPAGNYVARCYKLVEIGTVLTEYLGVEKMAHKVRFGWELPTEMKIFKAENGEQPLVIEKDYTLSLADKANLRKDLKSWRGKDFTPAEAEGFDIEKLLGVPCMLNIIHVAAKKDPTKIYEQIGSISPMPKGMVCPPQKNPTFIFSFDNYSDENFKLLPEFIRKQIVESNEYKEIHGQKTKEIPIAGAVDAYLNKDEPDDDLPF